MNSEVPTFTMLQLAQAFSKRLRHELGADLAEVIRRNRDEISPNVCHSHDFVDANMTMLEAVRDVAQEEPRTPEEEVALVHRYSQICDAAWTLARAHHFTL